MSAVKPAGGTPSTIIRVPRIFKMGPVRLNDPDPTMTPDEVRQHYCGSHGWLATATVSEPTLEGDELVFTFQKPEVKTKG